MDELLLFSAYLPWVRHQLERWLASRRRAGGRAVASHLSVTANNEHSRILSHLRLLRAPAAQRYGCLQPAAVEGEPSNS